MTVPMLRRWWILLPVLGVAGCAPQPAPIAPPPVMQSESPSPEPTAPLAVIEHGKGSYYADKFHGKTTASGALMDQDALTAASKDLPLGTKARVTNLETGKSVDVEVNDRGPYVPGRIIDLSKAAADAIDLKKDGVARVKVEALPAAQSTPELKRKVEKIAARRAARKAARHRKHKENAASSLSVAQ